MGTIDFDQINSNLLFQYPGILETWLPGGKLVGREYTCGDLSGGAGKSMKVNIDSGKWSDFSAGVSGGDPISLYAAIHGIKNGEAAKQLGGANFTPAVNTRTPEVKKQKKPLWTPIFPVPTEHPEPNFKHYKFGMPSKTWKYLDLNGVLLGYVHRFETDSDGKQIVPMVYADSGKKTEWRWLSFPKPRPLYNLPCLKKYPDANVIIVEGEKCADALREVFAGQPVCIISWPGGGKAVKHADWAILSGRKVVIWPDFDSKVYKKNHKKAGQLMPVAEQPGMVAAANISEQLPESCDVKIMSYAVDVRPDGWDCADLIDEQPDITPEEVLSFIRVHIDPITNPVTTGDEQSSDGIPIGDEPPEESQVYMPDNSEGPGEKESGSILHNNRFQLLGYDRGVYFYLPRHTKQVVELRPSAHTGMSLMQLAPLSWWEREFPAKKGVDWDIAADTLMQISASVGVYDPDRIRGRGAWEDAGRSVLHTGGHLVVDGRETAIDDHDTHYIYEVAKELDQQVSGSPLRNKQANEFAKLCERLNWSKSINGALLAGWCIVAPICGAISWRPHIWLTGSKGTGKSWIMENIVKPSVGGSALSVTSSTTEAGIRQTLGNDARPVVFDEAEGEDQHAQRRLQAVLELARQASSEAAAAIFKGTSSGRSMAFRVRSCFMFGSIGVNIQQDSDASRITILSLKPNHSTNASEQFEQLQRDVFGLLTPEYCADLRARSVSLVPIIRKNAVVFARAAAEHLGSQRAGDQIGALLAGYFSLFSTTEVTIDVAREWIKKRGNLWDEISLNGEEESDELRCLYAILGHTARVQGKIRTIDMSLGSLITVALGEPSDFVSQEEATSIIKNFGIRPDVILPREYFIVSNSDARLKKILRDTPWSNGWAQLLQRIDGAERKSPVTFSPGVRTRGTVLPVSLLEDETKEHQIAMDY